MPDNYLLGSNGPGRPCAPPQDACARSLVPLSGANEITIREDAPENLRYVALQTAIDLGWRPTALRSILCRVLRVPPDAGNWSEYPNIWGEVEGLMYGCPWFKVYDIIEALHAQFSKRDQTHGETDAAQFAEALNEFFIEEGIGSQRVYGKIVTRGTEAFETVVTEATSAPRLLPYEGGDLSRRRPRTPEPRSCVRAPARPPSSFVALWGCLPIMCFDRI